MPRSEETSRAFATTSFSCARPRAAKTGAAAVEIGAGMAACAAMQIVQDALSLWLG